MNLMKNCIFTKNVTFDFVVVVVVVLCGYQSEKKIFLTRKMFWGVFSQRIFFFLIKKIRFTKRF